MTGRGRPRSPTPAQPLVRIAYLSVAARDLATADIDAIAAASRRNNAARGLTGLLFHGGGRFYGLIEGPRRRVFARMERIVTDPRHRALQILREDAIDARRFANWSFCVLPESGSGVDDAVAFDRFLLGTIGRL